MFSYMHVVQANMGHQWREPNCLFFLSIPLLRGQLKDLQVLVFSFVNAVPFNVTKKNIEWSFDDYQFVIFLFPLQ